jgi:hypothetical protein
MIEFRPWEDGCSIFTTFTEAMQGGFKLGLSPRGLQKLAVKIETIEATKR